MNLVQLLAFDSLPFTFSSVRIISGELYSPGERCVTSRKTAAKETR